MTISTSFYSDRLRVGWVLVPDARGKGLGIEAVRAAHDWFDRVITGRLVCMIDPRNTRSITIAQNLGYQVLRDAHFEGQPVRLYERNGPPQ